LRAEAVVAFGGRHARHSDLRNTSSRIKARVNARPLIHSRHSRAYGQAHLCQLCLRERDIAPGTGVPVEWFGQRIAIADTGSGCAVVDFQHTRPSVCPFHCIQRLREQTVGVVLRGSYLARLFDFFAMIDQGADPPFTNRIATNIVAAPRIVMAVVSHLG